MIRRETDAGLANRIVNTAGIFTNATYESTGPIDLTPAIVPCVVLTNGSDAMQIWEQKELHIWEVITVFLPSCRGRRALEAGIAMREWMRPYTDMAFGSVPNVLPAAKWFYRKLGAQPVDRIETRHAVYTATHEGEQLFQYLPSNEVPTMPGAIPIGIA